MLNVQRFIRGDGSVRKMELSDSDGNLTLSEGEREGSLGGSDCCEDFSTKPPLQGFLCVPKMPAYVSLMWQWLAGSRPVGAGSGTDRGMGFTALQLLPQSFAPL